jgi:hypothetical protein
MAKCKYDPDLFPQLAEGYARDGLIEKDIAAKLNISVATLETYKIKYSEFLEALKRGKAPVDFEVENALLKRAKGYITTEKIITQNPDGTKTIQVKEKEVPPDTTACIFWLKNRKPREWRDKQEIEHSGEVQQSVIVLPANGRLMKEIPDGTVKPKAIE